mgnify:CR=1 FL=1
MSDIKAMIESLSAKDIEHLMANISNRRINTVNTSFRKRKNAITDLYFSVAPLPHKTTYEEYKLEAEAIRQQCISGVDIHD